MENQNNVNNEIKAEEEIQYVITNDGIRMTYKEWIEMMKAERNEC